jgi:Tol biopolymer transport system component
MSLAPNCCWLCFPLLTLAMAVPLSAAGDGYKIWIMNADGGQAHEVVSLSQYRDLLGPRWSHDGNKIAFFAKSKTTGGHEVFIANADGSDPRSFVEGMYPDWSVDDKQLLITNGNVASVVNIDGSGRKNVGAGYGQFSPDGSQIAFLSPRKAKLTVLDSVTGTERALDLPLVLIRDVIAWSPAGKSLAVFGYTKEKDRGRKPANLLIVGAAGEMPRVRLEVREVRKPSGLSYSPDGKQLVFSEDGQILVVDVDGDTPPRVLQMQNGWIDTPDFSPDGKRIMFSCSRTK